MKKEKSFFDKVYDIVSIVPPGTVITYGMIAVMLGNPRASRAVGYAMNNAPERLKLPCHRVVNQAGSMAPGNIFGGATNQRIMLEHEGVTFKEDGRIDMDKHLIRWNISET